ncbi:MAG: UDP-2,3-diacylglucosamine diphosphatase [Bacteroidia bacterium]|nr:UDP-2,3-diacylglucosamine diphosphatase [Bacteroidia bacterium]
MPRNRIFFISDFHLGAPDPERSLLRERHVARWIREVACEASDLYLLGDIFDFWFEYRHAVPKGYTRLLGELARFADEGGRIHLFPGNHDLWYRDYFTRQFGAVYYPGPIVREFFGRHYFIAHGDGLGPGDSGYKLMRRVVTHPVSKRLFRLLHPDLGIGLALWLSRKGGNHVYHADHEEQHRGAEAEFLYQHAIAHRRLHPEICAYVHGHRHLLIDDELETGERIVLIGDWERYYSYLEIHETGHELRVFPPEGGFGSLL